MQKIYNQNNFEKEQSDKTHITLISRQYSIDINRDISVEQSPEVNHTYMID